MNTTNYTCNKIPTTRTLRLYKLFSYYTRPYFYKILLHFFITSLMILTGAITIWMIGRGFDDLNKTNFKVVPEYLAGFIALIILLQVLRYANYYLLEWVQQRVIYSIRREMYRHLLELGIPFRDKSSIGDLLTRLNQDITRISEFLTLTPTQLFSYSLNIIIYLGILFYIDTRITIIASLLFPLIFIHQRFFINKTRETAQKFLSYQGKVAAFEEESLRNIQGIITFSSSTSMLKRFDKLFIIFRHAAMNNLLINNAFIISFELLIACVAILLVTIGIYSIEKKLLTVGELINFLLYLGYLSAPLRGLANIPIESQLRAAATERIAEIFGEQATITDKPSAIDIEDVFGTITFNNVSFKYSGNTEIFKDLSLQIKNGEHVAIMGASGTGKSTFIKLLIRIYDPSKGGILIGDQDLRDITLNSLRSHIAIVWQEPFLINDTIFENLRLCSPEATENKMREALKASYADEFIEQLPDGYDTYLGNDGSRLSTGQKQRIAIAQALLKQTSILILDEATSALDHHSELMIQRALYNLPDHCTVIFISHRLSSISNTDRIIYFNKNGSITTGTHRELKEVHPEFQSAIEHQNTIGI